MPSSSKKEGSEGPDTTERRQVNPVVLNALDFLVRLNLALHMTALIAGDATRSMQRRIP